MTEQKTPIETQRNKKKSKKLEEFRAVREKHPLDLIDLNMMNF